jgi:hypothetical protein
VESVRDVFFNICTGEGWRSTIKAGRIQEDPKFLAHGIQVAYQRFVIQLGVGVHCPIIALERNVEGPVQSPPSASMC